jgi:hypothetical protein
LAGGFPNVPEVGVEMGIALSCVVGMSGCTLDPTPPSAEGLSRMGRWPYESVSPLGPAAAILLRADNLCKQGLSVLFEYEGLWGVLLGLIASGRAVYTELRGCSAGVEMRVCIGSLP